MDTNTDQDAPSRAQALETTMWLLDHSGRDMFELDEVLQIAMCIEHYLTGGASVSFECTDRLRKFVRGM